MTKSRDWYAAQAISLEAKTGLTVSVENYLSFLQSVSYNFGYDNNVQLAIWKQRPNATAVLPFTTWTQKFHYECDYRKRILVNNGDKVIFYADISDITKTDKSIEIPQWKADHEALAQSFEVENIKTKLLELSRSHSLVSPVKDDAFKNLYELSLAYIYFYRCEVSEHKILPKQFSHSSVKYVLDNYFDSFLTELSAAAAVDLRIVRAAALASPRNADRTFDENKTQAYNKDNRNSEKGVDYDDNDLNDSDRRERISGNGQHISAGGTRQTGDDIKKSETLDSENGLSAELPIGQMVQDEIPVSSGTQPGTADRVIQNGSSLHSPEDHSPASSRESLADRRESAQTGTERGHEIERSPQMDRDHEQHTSESRGNSDTGDTLQLNINNDEVGNEALPAFFNEPLQPQMSFFNLGNDDSHNTQPIQDVEVIQRFVISQQVIDEALCLGSNNPSCLEHICAFFAKDYPIEKNAAFLQKEYGVDGKGFYFDSRLISLWFDEKGIRITEGRTANVNRAVLQTWDDVARQIRELLDMGRYVPQSILDNSLVNERKDLATSLWYIVQDFSKEAREAEFLPTILEIYNEKGGFPENTAQIAELLKNRACVDTLITEMTEFTEQYDHNHNLLRFNYHRQNKTLEQLQGLQRQHIEFSSQSGFSHEAKQFITDDEIDKLLIDGRNVQHSKLRIYAYFLEGHTSNEISDFLKHEYGQGGSGGFGCHENHDSKGIEYSRGDIFNPLDKVLLKWNSVAKRIDELIKQGRYMTEKELAYIPTYEKENNEPKSEEAVGDKLTKESEISGEQRYNFRITDRELGIGTPSEKYEANVTAIRLLQKIEAEGRLATPQEQTILSKYVGWGGLADCFDERNSKYAELKSLLTDEEYAAARESTLTAFYTSPIIIEAMFKALVNMGFKTGKILEPSCGIGNFLGMLPEDMRSSQIDAVELDTISGTIAKHLYPDANINITGYEDFSVPNNDYDICIGNVPFGQIRINDKNYGSAGTLIHDYFFMKSIDKVRPGGVVAFITSKGTLDKESAAIREQLSVEADFLGAVRLPNSAFKGNAGTEVTSDIIFLQKRESEGLTGQDWLSLDRDDNDIRMNSYFVNHPEQIIGKMAMVSSTHGPESACLPEFETTFEEQLEKAIDNIKGVIPERQIGAVEVTEQNTIDADMNVRNFSFTVVDNKLYYRENSKMFLQNVSGKTDKRIKGMIEVRDKLRTLISFESEDADEQSIVKARDELNILYDHFTKEYGLLNSKANAAPFHDDNSAALLLSLEELDEDGHLKKKADILSKRTIRPTVVKSSADTVQEALALSLNNKGRVDMEYMCSLFGGKDEKEMYSLLKTELFRIPIVDVSKPVEYVTADEYLSGDVREKYQTAVMVSQIRNDYKENVEALRSVIPKDLDATDIKIQLGSIWVPEEIIQEFVFDLLKPSRWVQVSIHVKYSSISSEWNISSKGCDARNVRASNTFGTSRKSAYNIIEDTLNLRDVRVYDYIEDENGKKKRVLNVDETGIAQGKQDLIKQEFQNWIWKDINRRERLVRLYNDRFNSIVPHHYDGSHLDFSGMNTEITLKDYQKDAVARILYGGNSLLAHEVGAGKTFEMTAAAMKLKQSGLCHKSLIVVPNHLTEQWSSEFLNLYPNANILVAATRDFQKSNRQRFISRIATGDYDAIIIGHSQFEKIPMSIRWQEDFYQEQLDAIIDGIFALKHQTGERFTVKQLELQKKLIESKIQKLNDQSRKDDVITFEELGVDRLFVDEAHFYKNLFLYTKMRNVRGISQTEAQKSSDLQMKCAYLDSITFGKGVVFATGTPISNSMVELYTMQRYLQTGMLKKQGLYHFDAWASTFGETVTSLELAPEGTGYRAVTRFAKFHNIPELMAMFKEVADIKTADVLNLPVPIPDFHNIVLPPSEYQKAMVEALADRAGAIHNGYVDPHDDNMLKIVSEGRKLALDQRIINSALPDYYDNKVSACADNVYKLYVKHNDTNASQLVFCDLSTPGNKEFNIYDELKNKLVQKGVDPEKVEFIHNSNTDIKKKELFAKVRSGTVRILIGSTQKMGAGTNVQERLIAIHDLDCPWKPSDLQQRLGRIVRQKNMFESVDVFRYVTEGTFDAYMYQIVENKQKFISQIMTSKDPAREAEDVDECVLKYEEIKALASGNPMIIEKVELEGQVRKLQLYKQHYLRSLYELEYRAEKTFPDSIAKYESAIDFIEKDIQTAFQHPLDESGVSPMVIFGETYTEKKAQGSALLAVCQTIDKPDTAHEIGSYRGFKLNLMYNSFGSYFTAELVGAAHHPIRLGSDLYGNIQRLNNYLNNDLSKELEYSKMELVNTRNQLAEAKKELALPFAQEAELNEKEQRLSEVNTALNLNFEQKNERFETSRKGDERSSR